MMFLFSAAVYSAQVIKAIGSGSCSLTVTYTDQGSPVTGTVTNSTKLNSLLLNNYVYSNASFEKSGDCSQLRVYDHAKGEPPVAIDTLMNKNSTLCSALASQRHYMFDLWNSTQIEQELNLYYVCPQAAQAAPTQGSSASSMSAMAALISIVLSVIA